MKNSQNYILFQGIMGMIYFGTQKGIEDMKDYEKRFLERGFRDIQSKEGYRFYENVLHYMLQKEGERLREKIALLEKNLHIIQGGLIN